MAGELPEQEAGLRSEGETTTARPPSKTVRAALSAATVLLPLAGGVEQQARSGGEQHIALPRIEGQRGDALGPSNGNVARRTQMVSFLRASCGAGPAALEGSGAHASVACTRAIA